MKIGIISEGHADRAVITNIITGLTGFDKNNIVALRPIYYTKDETDKALINKKTYSTWSVVKQECEERELIDGFLAFEGQDFVVIHIDSAEADLYGIKKPDRKNGDYCKELRILVIDQINTWLDKEMSNDILYAVAIEEIDAWILPIYEKKDSTLSPNPKERLSRVLGKKGINSTSNYDNYLYISQQLSKAKEIKKGNYLDLNYSLNAFFDEVKTKVLPKLNE